MKAILTTAYGAGEVLEVGEVETPVIGPGEILVHVRAFGINPVDWKIRRGDARVLTGRVPPRVLGADYAGVVVETGPGVSTPKVGEEVFGLVHAFRGGAYAEYVKVAADRTCRKPKNASFEEAAALPVAALTAYQSLVHEARLEPGHHVLVNGCSGGVGIFGIQIAKALGCTVTGVCSQRNASLARELGADHVIDYAREDVLAARDAYDIFFDAVGNQRFSKAKRTLRRGGTYATTLPTPTILLFGRLINLVDSRRLRTIMVKPSRKTADDLAAIGEMVEQGNLVPRIEKVYAPEEIREAHARSETGRVVGKLVVRGFERQGV